jgi:hypothetical protein
MDNKEYKRQWYLANKARIAAAQKEYNKKYYEANKEKENARNKAYRESNKEKVAAAKKVYSEVNKDTLNAYNKEYKVNNKGKINALNRGYQASKLQRTPAWLTEDDHWMIEQVYELAALRTKMLGFEWHVDHIIPLQGKLVSGLHVPTNLAVIPAKENLSKNNSYTP